MKSTKNILLLCLIIISIAGAAFYFLYFIRTPAYALNAARSAYQQHDLAKFERYVDLNSVMDNAFEDIIKAESKINHDNIFSNPFALGILHMLKPTVVDLLVQEARDKIANTPAKLQPADPVPDAMKRNMERRIHMDKLTISDLRIIKTEAGQATAALALYNKDLHKNFIAELKMEYNSKGDWQIKSVGNLTELIVSLDAAKKAKLAAANKPIMEKLNKAVQAVHTQLDIIPAPNSQTSEKLLATVITVKNTGSVGISRMYYDVTVFDHQGRQLYAYPEHFQGNIPPGATAQLLNKKKLSPLLPDDKKLIEHNKTEETCAIQVTYIVFDDGSVLSPSTFIE